MINNKDITTSTQQTNKLLNYVFCEMPKDTELKEIPNTDGYYFIQSNGDVISLHGKKAKPLKPYNCGNDYLYVKIKGKNKRIHRLVSQAFIDNTDNKPITHHKDNNKQNNNVNNLQWATAKENSQEYQKHKVQKEKEQENEKVLSAV